MSTALLIVAVLVAALACPAMIWFSQRRGRSAPCCPPRRTPDAEPSVDELRRQHAEISAALADRVRDASSERPAQTPAA